MDDRRLRSVELRLAPRDRRRVRRSRSGHHRRVTRRVPGVDRARLHRRPRGSVGRARAWPSRALHRQRRGNALSHSVVDHRIGPVRRRHQPDFPLSPVRYPPGIGLVDITRGK